MDSFQAGNGVQVISEVICKRGAFNVAKVVVSWCSHQAFKTQIPQKHKLTSLAGSVNSQGGRYIFQEQLMEVISYVGFSNKPLKHMVVPFLLER